MNNEGRVVLCGQIAVYNTDLPYPPPLPEHTTKIIKERNIQRERYLVLMYKDEIDEAVAQLSEWLQQDKIKVNSIDFSDFFRRKSKKNDEKSA